MEKPGKPKYGFFRSLGRFFLTTVLGGVVVILPISIFFILFRFALNFLVNIIAPLSNLLRIQDTTSKMAADIMAIVIIALVFFIIGLIVQMPRGRAFFRWLEKTYLEMIPLYSTIRETVQQFTGKTTPFSQVVMADVFGNDTRMLGFITDELENDMFSIFVPTGPNPTNGFVFHVKRSQLEFLDARSEDAMRSIVAVGTGTRKMMNNAKSGLGRKSKYNLAKEEPLPDKIGAPSVDPT